MPTKSSRRPALFLAAAATAALLLVPSSAFAGGADLTSCAVQNTGKIFCWGLNSYGQLGNNSTTSSVAAVEVSGITTGVQVSPGLSHTCAVLSSGKVNCWGRNHTGQLGNGLTTDSRVPVEVSGITDAVQVSTNGGGHSCALLSSRSIKCWGPNSSGQLGNNSTTDSMVPVDVSGITNAVQVSVGWFSTCALLSTRKVMCWGNNDYGQLGINSTTASKVPAEVSGITNAVNISSGTFHACAALSSGKVNCWGGTLYQLGNASFSNSLVPVEVSGITSALRVSAGPYHTCAVLNSGKVNCWGENGVGTLGDGTYEPRSTPVEVTGLEDATQVMAAQSHTCAIVQSGKAYCWGRNGDPAIPPFPPYFPGSPAVVFGALGNASVGATVSSVPVQVDDVSMFSRIDELVVSLPPVDTTAPATPGSFTGVPSSPTNSTGATIGFTLGESGGTVECRVDSDTWGACTSVSGTTGSHTLSGLSDGSHTLSVRQADDAGNVSEIATTPAWTVDTVAPAAPVLSGAPTGTVMLSSATVSFTAKGSSSFTCSLDGGAYSACTSPRALSGLAAGAHTFSVKATDAAGNTSNAETATWTVAAISAPTLLTPAAGTKTVVKATVDGKPTWVMKLGLLFSTGGDTRSAAQFLTVQVAVDSAGRPVSTKPSDSQALPTAATFARGVVGWNASGDVSRATASAPVWVRVGNRSGKWTAWARLTQ